MIKQIYLPRNSWLAILILTAAYFALRLPWLLCLPITEAPDEANHLWVVKFLSEHLRVPSAHEVLAAGSTAEYGPLPPFGYLPNVMCGTIFNGPWFRLAARFGTLLAGFPTMLVAYALGKELFDDRPMAMMLPLLVVIHPQLIFTDAYTNSDGLVITLCSLSIYIVVRAIKYGAELSKALLIGFLMGWAVLSKTNSLALVPALMLGLWFSCQIQKNQRYNQRCTEFARIILPFAGMFILTCGWWYVRNCYEYGGDLLGSRTMIRIWEATLPHINGVAVKPWPSLASLAWWRYVFFDYWGLFGFMTRYLWRPLYLLFLALCLISGWGWVRPPKKTTPAASSPSDANQANQTNEVANKIWQFFAACFALNMVAVVYVTITGVSGPHGRYLFPSELPILSLLLAGFARFGPRFEHLLSLVLVSTCLVSTAYGWIIYYAGQTWGQ